MIRDMTDERKLRIIEEKISVLATNYRSYWKEELWESKKIEEFGFNEYVGGMAEAYEDCLVMIESLKVKDSN